MRTMTAALTVFALWGCVSARTQSAPPQPSVASIVEGVGFVSTPSQLQLLCEQEICVVTSQTAGIRWEIEAPRDLKYYGFGCPGERRQGENFAPPIEFVVSDDEITLTYSGSPRCGRQVVERFVRTDDFEPRAAAAFIASTYGLWRACGLTSSDSVACSTLARATFRTGQDQRLAQIEAWVAR